MKAGVVKYMRGPAGKAKALLPPFTPVPLSLPGSVLRTFENGKFDTPFLPPVLSPPGSVLRTFENGKFAMPFLALGQSNWQLK